LRTKTPHAHSSTHRSKSKSVENLTFGKVFSLKQMYHV